MLTKHVRVHELTWKFLATSFHPGTSQDNHPSAVIAAQAAAAHRATQDATQALGLPFGDNSDAEHEDDSGDDDLLELTQGPPSKVSEAIALEVCPQCLAHIPASQFLHRDLPGRLQLPGHLP